MTNVKKAIPAKIAAIALCASMVVSATTVSVSGGTWNYGSNALNVWSRYYHPTSDHHSTCKGILTSYSGKVAAGVTSDAWTKSNPFGGNRAWYGLD